MADENRIPPRDEPEIEAQDGDGITASDPDAAAASPVEPSPAMDLRPDSERMILLLDAPAPGPDQEQFLDSLQSAINHLEIADPPPREELSRIIAAAEPVDGRLVDVELIRGIPPVMPQDGRIDWTRDFFATGFMVDDATDRADYRQRKDNLSVAVDDLLAHLYPPIPGEPGRDVFGNKIPVRRPHKSRLRKGPNVRIEEDPDGVVRLYSEMEGRLRFADGQLAVDEVYSIRGSVGMQTGNVRHPGAVEIDGDIRAGARVDAKGDVIVRGMVEPACVVSGGSLVVQGGIVGGKDMSIVVDGGVRARYILEADITAGGDVEAEREINHSRIRARGQVLVPKGRMVGGEVSALGGIVVQDAGADGLGRTLLICGLDYRLEEIRSECGKAVRKLGQKRQKTLVIGRQLMGIKKLAPTQKQALEDTRRKIREIDEEIRRKESDLEEAVYHSQQMARPNMRIEGTIFSETVLQLRDSRHKVAERMTGPFNVLLRNGLVTIKTP